MEVSISSTNILWKGRRSRALAVLRRLVQVSCHMPPNASAAALYLVSKIFERRAPAESPQVGRTKPLSLSSLEESGGTTRRKGDPLRVSLAKKKRKNEFFTYRSRPELARVALETAATVAPETDEAAEPLEAEWKLALKREPLYATREGRSKKRPVRIPRLVSGFGRSSVFYNDIRTFASRRNH